MQGAVREAPLGHLSSGGSVHSAELHTTPAFTGRTSPLLAPPSSLDRAREAAGPPSVTLPCHPERHLLPQLGPRPGLLPRRGALTPGQWHRGSFNLGC